MHAFLVSLAPQIPAGPDVLEIHPDPSIGIESIRDIQTFLSRKPLRSPANTVIVHQAHKLTLPAQHAFLKTLEEPPAGSTVFLVTGFADQLLPTIHSRVQIIDTPFQPSQIDTEPAIQLFKHFSGASLGQKMAYLDSLNTDRDQALALLDSLEHYCHQNISSRKSQPLNYSVLYTIRRDLLANVNVKLCLDQLALDLFS